MDKEKAAFFYNNGRSVCPFCKKGYAHNRGMYADDQLAHERNNTPTIVVDWECEECDAEWDESYDMNYITSEDGEMIHYDDLPEGSIEDWEE